LILDPNALSAFADGEPGVGEILRRHERAAIPVIVLGEFRYGIAGSRHRRAYEQWLEALLSELEVLAITAQTSISYAALRGTLKQRGRPIPANDAWIAALAMQHRMPILSRDEHFDALPELRRVSW
jgi:tRNA(fMet)-specific endonuclease VapC